MLCHYHPASYRREEVLQISISRCSVFLCHSSRSTDEPHLDGQLVLHSNKNMYALIYLKLHQCKKSWCTNEEGGFDFHFYLNNMIEYTVKSPYILLF